MTSPPVAMSAENVEATVPPAVKEGEKVVGGGPEVNSRKPMPLVRVAVTCGNWFSTDDGTVSVPAPAVLVQTNSVAVVTVVEPVVDVVPAYPIIATDRSNCRPSSSASAPGCGPRSRAIRR